MQTFVWDDSLSTGVPMIDAHHKELISAFNDLAAAIEQGKTGAPVKKLLTFMEFYADWHFGHEESCAAKHQCAIAATNQQAHHKFLQIFRDLKQQYSQSDDQEAVARQAHTELSDWLVSHILKIDTQIGHCIQSAQA